MLCTFFEHALQQIYTAYVESQEQLQLEKLENKRVNKYLDDIVQEVEAKAPILKRQREELERTQKSVASLSAKLEHAVQVSKKRTNPESAVWSFLKNYAAVLVTEHVLARGKGWELISVAVLSLAYAIFCILSILRFTVQ